MPQEPELVQIVYEHRDRLEEDVDTVFKKYNKEVDSGILSEIKEEMEEKISAQAEWLIGRIEREQGNASEWEDE